jgi:Peptidase family C25
MNSVSGSKPFVDVVTELLSRGYRVRFRAEGASMRPTIRGGEKITVEPVSEVKLGDIALFRAERGLIAHRVVGIQKGIGKAPVFLTRGEAGGSYEEAVQEQQILGKVVAVERNGHSIDLGGRWAKIRCSTRSFARLARHWGETFGGVRGAGVFLLVSVLVAVCPSVARANVAITKQASTNASGGGNTCTISSFDANTGSPNLILIGMTFLNNNGITSVTSSSGTVAAVQTLTGVSSNAFVAIYKVTAFTNGSLTLQGNFNGANGFVCGAVAFSGVNLSQVGPAWSPTTSNSPGMSTSSPSSITGTAPGPGGVVFDVVSLRQQLAVTHGANQVQQWQVMPTGAGTGAASVASNVSAMSWTWTGTSVWAAAAVPIGPTSTTEVQPNSFTVTQCADRNLIELKTGREVSSLGFNLYREQNGRRVRLNSSLLAGTALLAGSKTTLTAGHVHTWWDAPPGGIGSVSYSVEEVDLHGQRTWYGPATPRPVEPERGDSVDSTALIAAEARDAAGQVVLLSRVGREVAAPGTGVRSTSHALQARAAPTMNISQKLRRQYALAAGPAVKIGVQSEGWYRVAGSDLLAAGLDPNADANTLRLYAEGVEQPILVQEQAGDKLAPQSNIQFYGMGLDTTWSDTRVYWLTWGNGSGRRVQAETLQPGGTAAGPSNFPFTVEWKPRTVYFAALLNGDADNFFGPVLMSGEPVSQAMTILHLDQNAAGGGQLRLALQGVSNAPHNVVVALNGSQVGTVTFTDQTVGVATLAVPITTVQEGQNLLTLTVEGGEGDVSVVDVVELSYPHTYMADNDSLRLTAPGGQAETIEGFSNSQISVVDISDPEAVTLVPGTITQQAGSYGVTIVPQGGGTRILLAFTSAQDAQPASITANHPSSWHAPQTGFDMVMISHANFVPSLGPLVTYHQGQGLKVAVIDVDNLYGEFNFGEKSPYALKDFLSTARAQWQIKPRFVLLVGDASFDPRNFLGVGSFDFVPTYLVETALLETASDDWFADFSGQGIPQLAIGRLPVRSAQAAAALVSKIVNYDQSGDAAWKKQVLLVADQNDSDNNFEANAAAVKALLPGDLSVSEIFRGSSSANGDLLNGLNVQGQAMVNYVGHGSEQVWAGGLLNSTDADGMTNGSMVPFVVAMTCLNGYFQDVYGTALAKALIEAPGGGALAVWASSGLTDSGSQAAMNQALIKALFGTQPMTIGEAAATAKAVVSDLDVRRTWILFGDPATMLK